MSVMGIGPGRLFGPISDVVGFSERDGLTHLEIQRRMRTAILDVIAAVNTQNDRLRTGLTDVMGNALTAQEAAQAAEASSARAKLDFVSVKDYGAVGDGTTDDTEAVTNAILTGRPVYFPDSATAYRCNVEIDSDIPVKLQSYGTAVISPYDSSKPAISVNCTSITTPKIVSGLRFSLSGDQVGVKIALPSFVDNYYPHMVKVDNLDFYCTDDFTGDCVALEYIREITVRNIGIKRQRIQDFYRNGVGLNMRSCMNIRVTGCNFGFLDKAVYVHNGGQGSEGISVSRSEMFFCNYGVYVASDNSKTCLDMRVSQNMIDQVQTAGVYFDGVMSFYVEDNYIGCNVANSDAVVLDGVSRECYAGVITNNSLWLNLAANSHAVKFVSATHVATRVNISDNQMFNYYDNCIYGAAVSSIVVQGNLFSTSSGTANNPFNVTTITSAIFVANIVNGSTFVNPALVGHSNINAKLYQYNSTAVALTADGASHQFISDKDYFVTLILNNGTGASINCSINQGNTAATLGLTLRQSIGAGEWGTMTFMVKANSWYSISVGALTVNTISCLMV